MKRAFSPQSLLASFTWVDDPGWFEIGPSALNMDSSAPKAPIIPAWAAGPGGMAVISFRAESPHHPNCKNQSFSRCPIASARQYQRFMLRKREPYPASIRLNRQSHLTEFRRSRRLGTGDFFVAAIPAARKGAQRQTIREIGNPVNTAEQSGRRRGIATQDESRARFASAIKTLFQHPHSSMEA